jgi:hypothetical protein
MVNGLLPDPAVRMLVKSPCEPPGQAVMVKIALVLFVQFSEKPTHLPKIAFTAVC